MLLIRSYGSLWKLIEWMLVRSYLRNCLFLYGKECKYRFFCDLKGGMFEDFNWFRDNICGIVILINYILFVRKFGEEFDELV